MIIFLSLFSHRFTCAKKKEKEKHERNDGRSQNDMNRFSFLLYFHYTGNPLKRSKSFIRSKPISLVVFNFKSLLFILKLQFNSFHFQSKHTRKKNKKIKYFSKREFNRDPLFSLSK